MRLETPEYVHKYVIEAPIMLRLAYSHFAFTYNISSLLISVSVRNYVDNELFVYGSWKYSQTREYIYLLKQ